MTQDLAELPTSQLQALMHVANHPNEAGGFGKAFAASDCVVRHFSDIESPAVEWQMLAVNGWTAFGGK